MSPWRQQLLLHARAVLLKPRDEGAAHGGCKFVPSSATPSLTTNEGDWPDLRWKPDLSPEAIFKKPQAGEMKSPSLDKLLLRSAKKPEIYGGK